MDLVEQVKAQIKTAEQNVAYQETELYRAKTADEEQKVRARLVPLQNKLSGLQSELADLVRRGVR